MLASGLSVTGCFSLYSLLCLVPIGNRCFTINAHTSGPNDRRVLCEKQCDKSHLKCLRNPKGQADRDSQNAQGRYRGQDAMLSRVLMDEKTGAKE